MPTFHSRFALGLALALATSGIAQPSWPTPVDSNSNGTIDSAEIQAVFDTVASGIVFLPANKTYNIDVPVVIDRDNITLLGEGHGVSSAGGTIFKINADIEGLIIRDCSGSGAKAMSVVAPTGTHTNYAVRLEDTTDAFLTDLRVTNAYNGVAILNCDAPVITDVSLRAHSGPFGFRVWGSGGTTTDAVLSRVTGAGVTGNTVTEWLVIGPSVNGLTLQSSRFIGALHGMRLTGTPAPTAITTIRYGADNQAEVSFVAETGSNLTMINSWIGQAGGKLESGFSGPANLTNFRVRGAFSHGLQVDGGSDLNLWNPFIGASGTDPSAGSTTIAGVQLAAAVSDVRIVGGRIGPVYSQGGGAKQYYGVHYLGTTTQSDTNNVKTRGTSLGGNSVRVDPANLPSNN